MAQIRFQQGEDYDIALDLLKNNQAVDISAAVDIRARVYVNDNPTNPTAQPAAQYSVSPVAGYGVAVLDGVISNRLRLKVERTQSRTFPTGAISVYILVQFPDPSYPTGVRHDEFMFRNIGYIDIGRMIDEPLP